MAERKGVGPALPLNTQQTALRREESSIEAEEVIIAIEKSHYEDPRVLRPETRLGSVWRFARCRDC